MRLFFASVFSFLVLTSSSAQFNRGFKSYKRHTTTIKHLFALDSTLNESSALCFWNGLFWTLNDSGGEPFLYGFETNNKNIKHIIRVTNAKNTDWEALAQDSQYFYIGDFGNNKGNRKDLCILKVQKKEIHNKETDVHAERIEYFYPEQKKFKPRNLRNRWDCEAMIVYHDSLLIITKNWVNGFSSIYSLPKIPGNYAAQKFSSFNAEGQVTDASLSADGKKLALVGYRDFVPFVTIINNFEPNAPQKWKVNRYDLPTWLGTQTEGICFFKNNLYICCEKTKLCKQSLFSFER
jgi:hypothetical protein